MTDTRLGSTKAMKAVTSKIEVEQQKARTAQSQIVDWTAKLAELQANAPELAARANLDNDATAKRLADGMLQDIARVEITLAGAEARELSATQNLAGLLAERELVAKRVAEAKVKSLAKKIITYENQTTEMVVALTESYLELKKIALETEVLSLDYKVDNHGVTLRGIEFAFGGVLKYCLRIFAGLDVEIPAGAKAPVREKINSLLEKRGSKSPALVEAITALPIRKAREAKFERIEQKAAEARAEEAQGVNDGKA